MNSGYGKKTLKRERILEMQSVGLPGDKRRLRRVRSSYPRSLGPIGFEVRKRDCSILAIWPGNASPVHGE